jgi:uncharacterized membrane protein
MKLATWTDDRVEMLMGELLKTGVLLAGFTVLLGGTLYLLNYWHMPAEYHSFHGEPAELRSVLPVIRNAYHLNSRSVIQLGLLLLIATPVARVAFSLFAFWRQRDRVYATVTFIVLAILLYGLFGYTL